MAKIIRSESGLQPLDPDNQPSPPSVVQVQQVHYEETAQHKEWNLQLSTGELKVVRLLSDPKTNKERGANKAAGEFLESVIGLKSVERHSSRQRRKTKTRDSAAGEKAQGCGKTKRLAPT